MINVLILLLHYCPNSSVYSGKKNLKLFFNVNQIKFEFKLNLFHRCQFWLPEAHVLRMHAILQVQISLDVYGYFIVHKYESLLYNQKLF